MVKKGTIYKVIWDDVARTETEAELKHGPTGLVGLADDVNQFAVSRGTGPRALHQPAQARPTATMSERGTSLPTPPPTLGPCGCLRTHLDG